MPQDDRQQNMMKSTSKFAGIGGAVLVLASLFLATYYPAERAALWVLGAAGGACLLFFFISERHILGRAPGSRSARHGANAAAIVLAFLGILVVLNILSIRHNLKWDSTEGKIFTRSEQTVQVLKGLGKDVTVTAFFADGAEERQRM